MQPHSRGGKNAFNLVGACNFCNQAKGMMMPLEFIVLKVTGSPINGWGYLNSHAKKLLRPKVENEVILED
jgi:hypothetical protein